MVYVFKTSVQSESAISDLKPALDNLAEEIEWNFDLEDCDNILRIDSKEIQPSQVISLLQNNFFYCEEL